MTLLPNDSLDCHVHVFGPRLSYCDWRDYTPGLATAEALRQHHGSWRIRHSVIVQASVYGTDNSCLLDALSQLGRSARAVAVIDPNQITGEALSDLAKIMIGGFRLGQGRTAKRSQPEPDPFV